MNLNFVMRCTWPLVAAILTGCAATSVPTDFVLKGDSDKGLVVISVSQGYSAAKSARAVFYMDRGTISAGTQLWSRVETIPGSFIYKQTEFKDSLGQLIVLELPAGAHQIDSWHFTNGSLNISPNGAPMALKFEVIPGQIKYLGNLHAHLQAGKNVFGMRLGLVDGYPEVRDKGERDIPMFEQRYPQFAGKVVVDLLELGPWLRSSAEGRKAISTMPVIPVVPIQK